MKNESKFNLSQWMVFGFTLLFTGFSYADTFIVTHFTDDSNGCNSGVSCSLRAAINSANVSQGNDDIFLTAGTYNLSLGQITINDSGLDNAINIFGSGDWNTSIISSTNDRILSINNSVVQIFDLTLTGGSSQNSGGAISAVDSLVAVVDSTLVNNESGFNGGAIFAYRNAPNVGALRVIRSRLLSNKARSGSAFYCGSGVECDLVYSTIEGNSANVGQSSSHGAPIYIKGGTGVISGSTVYNNTGTEHGGIFIESSLGYKIIRSTISANTAINESTSSVGGVKVDFSSNIEFKNNTLVNNTSGGLVQMQFNGSTVTKFANNIVVDDCLTTGATIHSQGFNLMGNFDCNLNHKTDSQGVSGAEFDLVTLADNGGYNQTHDLGAFSQVRNFQTENCTGVDQRGVARNSPNCDVGAFQPTPCVSPELSIIDDDATGISSVINVDDLSEIVDLDVFVDISHTYLGDLEINLEHVQTGTSIQLANRVDDHLGNNGGCSFDDMKIIIDEDTSHGIGNDCETDPTGPDFQAFPGRYARYHPELDTHGSLHDFIDQSINGDWKLTIKDLATGDVGTLHKWCLLPKLNHDDSLIFKNGFE